MWGGGVLGLDTGVETHLKQRSFSLRPLSRWVSVVVSLGQLSGLWFHTLVLKRCTSVCFYTRLHCQQVQPWLHDMARKADGAKVQFVLSCG